ncbi:hypothetical protein ACH5RR_018417 [Cinchona calisaya]|uniref:Endonuclease/exonuclease/phosphatase n=1 Tax=Cinchona calisaya TaxID=153742 RepID=A0ABD2ZMN5_9GENT
MEKVKRILAFEDISVVEALNKAGGMIMIWKSDIVVEEVLQTAFTIEAKIVDKKEGMQWWFIGIYANSNASIRRQKCKALERRKLVWSTRWVLAGDFNDILSNKEKWGGRIRRDSNFMILEILLVLRN